MSHNRRKPRGEWSLCAHPEGALYHTAIIDDLRFSTDVNIYEEETFKELLDFTEHIRHRINVLGRAVDIRNAKNVEIVFDIDSDGTWEYYIADHKTRHLLWLEKYHIQTDIKGGAESFAHLSKSLAMHSLRRLLLTYRISEHKINLEYYIHLSYFPHRNSLPDNFFNELRGMITWTLSGRIFAF